MTSRDKALTAAADKASDKREAESYAQRLARSVPSSAKDAAWLIGTLCTLAIVVYGVLQQLSMDAAIKFFAGLQVILAYMGLTLPMALYQGFGLGLLIFVLVLFWRAQHSATNRFDVVDMFQDRGRTSAGSVFKVVAGFMGVFAFGWLLVSQEMTIGYFTAFAAIYYLGKSADKAIDAWKSDKSEDEAPKEVPPRSSPRPLPKPVSGGV